MSQVFRVAGACGVAKGTYKIFVFPLGPVLQVLIIIIFKNAYLGDLIICPLIYIGLIYTFSNA